MRAITSSEISTILSKDFTGTNNPNVVVMIDGYLLSNIINMTITREENSICQQVEITINNVNPDDYKDPGYYTQTRNDTANGKPQNDWYHVIQPGKELIVWAGYGLNVVTLFTGKVLTVVNEMNGNDCVIEIIGCNYGRLLQQGEINTYDTNLNKRNWYITYPIQADIYEHYLTDSDTNPYLHQIYRDVCIRAGIPSGKILYDEFSLRLNDLDEEYFTEVYGKWESIVTKIAKLLNASVFINEENQIELRAKKDLSYSVDDSITLNGYTWTSLAVGSNNIDRAIEDSIVFDAGYEKDVDWEFDLETNMIRRKAGGSFPDGTPVDYQYNYVNWVFRHGEGIYSFRNINTHEDLCYKIVAINEDEGLTSEGLLGTMGDGSTLEPTLIYREDLPELTTQGQLDDWVADYLTEIRKQYWGTKANIVAVPHLQINDLIQYFVTGMITGIYRIVGFTLTYSPENGFDMNIESAFYSNYNAYE